MPNKFNTFMGNEEELQRRVQEERMRQEQMRQSQMKMDAAMQENQTPSTDAQAAQINQQTQMGLGAVQQMSNMASNRGEGAGNVAQSGLSGAMGGAMMGTMMAGAGTGAATGAASGSMAGPIGAGVGAAVGVGVGLLQAKAAKEQRLREAQAAHHARIAQIEQEKATRIQNALSNMGMQMGQALQVPVVRI